MSSEEARISVLEAKQEMFQKAIEDLSIEMKGLRQDFRDWSDKIAEKWQEYGGVIKLGADNAGRITIIENKIDEIVEWKTKVIAYTTVITSVIVITANIVWTIIEDKLL